MNTYFARLHVEIEADGDAEQTKFDARPSDCIALAVRCNAEIQVKRELMDEAAVPRAELEGLEGEGEGEVDEDEDDFEFGGPEDIQP